MWLHFREQRGAASLRYRNRAEIIVIMREQKPYLVWFSCRHEELSGIVNIWSDMWRFTLEKAWRSIAALQKSRWNHRYYAWTEALSGMVFVPTRRAIRYSEHLIRYVTLHFRESVAQHRCVTEIALKSSLLCVNRSSIWYGFRADEKAIRYSANIA